MTREEAIEILKEDGCGYCTWQSINPYECENEECEVKQALELAIQSLSQEPLCDRLAREYISKVKYCDECFASVFCTINGLRNSREPQSYCIENIKKYFESKSEGQE